MHALLYSIIYSLESHYHDPPFPGHFPLLPPSPSIYKPELWLLSPHGQVLYEERLLYVRHPSLVDVRLLHPKKTIYQLLLKPATRVWRSFIGQLSSRPVTTNFRYMINAYIQATLCMTILCMRQIYRIKRLLHLVQYVCWNLC